MSTTYSNPKEMLGYLIVKCDDQITQCMANIPFDRRAVFQVYYLLRNKDAMLVSFREDMFIYKKKEGQKYDYYTVKEAIDAAIKMYWEHVYARDFDNFTTALNEWQELMSSSYAALGLVPESGSAIIHADDDSTETEEKELKEVPLDVRDRLPEQEPNPEPVREQPEPEKKNRGYKFAFTR